VNGREKAMHGHAFPKTKSRFSSTPEKSVNTLGKKKFYETSGGEKNL